MGEVAGLFVVALKPEFYGFGEGNRGLLLHDDGFNYIIIWVGFGVWMDIIVRMFKSSQTFGRKYLKLKFE